MANDSDIAIYGGTFNPPGRQHRRVVEALRQSFGNVVVVPCGPRPDKPQTDEIAPVYRAAMADMAFRGLSRVEVDLFDLEHSTFTRTHELEARYAPRGRLWHAIGAEQIAGGASGQSFIHRSWQHGPDLWNQLRFAVVRREGIDLTPADLPPQHRFIDVEADESSCDLREKLFRGEKVDGALMPDVAGYVLRHRLYQGGAPARAVRCLIGEPRLLIFADMRNPKAAAWADHFSKHGNPTDPNAVLVIGGDGTMLRAIQTHWRLRVPFFGLNAGHLGFLLNQADQVMELERPFSNVIARPMPLLYVEMQTPDGVWHPRLTFNDAWVERSTGQTAWLSVNVDGQPRLPMLVCDGLLLSTAAGSTAYALSMGATPLLADTPAWLIVGSNVMRPLKWKSALLSLDSTVEVRSLDTSKRPLNGFVCGDPIGEVIAMRARVSRIASVELAFCESHDITEKIANIQFPMEANVGLSE